MKKTWVKLFKEVLKINSVEGGKQWLEKESLNYKKRVKTISLVGARILIRSNLTYLAQNYFTQKEVEHLKRVIGLSQRIYH